MHYFTSAFYLCTTNIVSYIFIIYKIVFSGGIMRTIAVSDETLAALKELKRRLSAKTYDYVIRFLLKKVREMEIKRALEVLEIDDDEADKILDIVMERRRTW